MDWNVCALTRQAFSGSLLKYLEDISASMEKKLLNSPILEKGVKLACVREQRMWSRLLTGTLTAGPGEETQT